ncbi:neither inactivation nor afterpotential protein G-like isoform X2 [Panulirus ornatus]
MAARLSEVEHYRVLLVEAGGEEPWLSNIPLAAPLLQKSRFDWQYLTTPQKSSSLALVDKQSSWPRGRVLGGSATINYNIHMFGSPQDFQVWEDEYGATGWGFDEMKKYANKAECRRLRPKIFKQDQCSSNLGEKKQKGCSNSSRSSEGSKLGDGGHIRQHQDAVQCYSPPIRVHTAASTLTNTFLAAGKELGLPVGNLNDDIDYGVMAAETTVFKGRRWSASTGYLRPALGRPNLHVLIHTHVSRILWEGKRAVGVEFVQWNNAHLNGSVFARGEVILAAGAINTPLLLTHSGVGPKSILQKFNIPAISLLEGVGGNLQDHLNLPLYVSLEKSASLNPAKMGTLTNLWDYFVKGGKGDLGRTAIEGVGVMPLTGDQPEVGVILFNMGSVDKHLYSSIANIKLDYFDATFPNMDNQSAEGFIFLTSCLHPKSRGRVHLVSSDPRHPPSIDPNYLHHPYDITCMRDAFKFAMHLARTKAFQNLGATVHLPRHEECIPRGSRGETSIGGGGEDARSRYQDYVNCLVRVNAITGYHPLGTTRIGHPDDPKAVVDPKLRVIGTDRLRVIDASVMPTQISGTPNSAIVVIAEKAADLLRESWSDKSVLAREKICSSTPDCEEELLANISNFSPSSQSIFSVMIIFSVIWATYPYTSVTAVYL